MQRRNIARKLGKWCCIVVYLVIVMFPIFWIVLNSFKSARVSNITPPVFAFTPTLQAYKTVLFKGTPFIKFFINTLVISGSVAVISVILGSLAAYGLTRFKIKGKEHLEFYILSTRFLPSIGVALPFFVMFRNLNLLDTYFSLILVHLTITLSFSVWLLRGTFEEIPIELDESAMLDGASTLGVLFRIILPLSLPGMISIAILSWLFSWNEFLLAHVLTSFTARTMTAELPKFFGAVQIMWNELTAAGTLIMAPVLIVCLFVQRYFVRGLTMGAVKF